MQSVTKRRPSKSGKPKARQALSPEKRIVRNVQSLDSFLGTAQPHTPNQDLAHFANWAGSPVFVPPKDSSVDLAKAMLDRFSPLASKPDCWKAIEKEFRSQFTQVREIELPKASIRLPQGRLYVTVTPQDKFDEIEEKIPQCVMTRLDEFLAGPGKKRGVKVSYLKPLCIEVGSELIFTSKAELDEAIAEIQEEVFNEYRRRYLGHRAKRFAIGTLNAGLAIPRAIIGRSFKRKKREIEAFHAKLEFERRKRALETLHQWRVHRRHYHDDGCTFDDILGLTEAPDRTDVIDHYVEENGRSEIDRKMFLLASSVALPWFATLSLAAYQMVMVSLATTTTVAVCDPVFVAEMPGEKGKLLKIGHFDEVDGVMHVEI